MTIAAPTPFSPQSVMMVGTALAGATMTARSTGGGSSRTLGQAMTPETDRAMICGNLAFNLELKAMLAEYGLEERANSDPRHYVVEKAFLE